MTRCARTANGATRREWSRQLPGTPRPPSTRAATPTPPNDALWGESRHDHPDAPARRRGHPWPLEHASAVPTIAGHGAQRAVHNPAAEAHATSTLRSDDQKPCSGRNLDRESPPIIHGAPTRHGSSIARTASVGESMSTPASPFSGSPSEHGRRERQEAGTSPASSPRSVPRRCRPRASSSAGCGSTGAPTCRWTTWRDG